mmetsp:Transcript_8487/g.20890  ORF Transcript_8487/g.20890 Transcript_8487/m.20890 type:complete len:87 (+) Transcript_8487:449-709(+)
MALSSIPSLSLQVTFNRIHPMVNGVRSKITQHDVNEMQRMTNKRQQHLSAKPTEPRPRTLRQWPTDTILIPSVVYIQTGRQAAHTT